MVSVLGFRRRLLVVFGLYICWGVGFFWVYYLDEILGCKVKLMGIGRLEDGKNVL